ncbi:MAG: DUF5682 family protein [Ilumatobacteraceae bacterium]
MRHAAELAVSLRCIDRRSPCWRPASPTRPSPGEGRPGRDRRSAPGPGRRAAGYGDAERWWEDVVEPGRTLIPSAPSPARWPPLTATPRRRDRTTSRSDDAPGCARRSRRQPANRRGLRGVARPGPRYWLDRPGTRAVGQGGPSGPAPHQGRDDLGAWTNLRLGAHSGYGAGVSSRRLVSTCSPIRAGRGDPVVLRAAELLRAQDHAVSPDHLVAAVRLADSLAVLRAARRDWPRSPARRRPSSARRSEDHWR